MTQAVILAGGFGTRLGDLTREMPKPLLPVAGIPFLDILVSELRRQGVDRVLVIAGFRGDLIAAHFADQSDVTIVVETEPMGTGGALRYAQDDLAEVFFFLNGDSLLDINLHDLAAYAGEATATLALRKMPDISRYGEVELAADGRITRFAERPSRGGEGLINGGVGYFSRRILSVIDEGRQVSIEREVYPRLAGQNLLHGRAYDRPFIDIGVPEDYALAQAKVPALLRRGAVIFDRDGVLNEDIGYAHLPNQIRWIEGAKAAVKHVNDAGLLALIATNQAGVARGYYDEKHVESLHEWMIGELRKAGANIDGIIYCPFHPEGTVETYRRHSPMRKPAPGMIHALMARHGVDSARCVLIGDKATDMEAAAAAGIEGVHYKGGDLLSLVKRVVGRLRSPVTLLQGEAL